MKNFRTFFICVLIFTQISIIKHANASRTTPSGISQKIEIQDPEVNIVEEDEDDFIPSLSAAGTVEYEALAANEGAVQAVRKDGLKIQTIYKINENFALYGILRNPLNEREAKNLRDEVSGAQLYYKLAQKPVPEEVTILLRRANTLYQNTASSGRQVAAPPQSLQPDIKAACQKKLMSISREFYLKYCID